MSRWDQTDRELALGGLLRESGQADRLFPPTELYVPSGITLVETADGPALGLSGGDDGEDRWRSDTRGLLTAFAKLEERDPEAFLAFARSWGLLELCHHGLPASHNPPTFPPHEAAGLRWTALSALEAGLPEVTRSILEKAPTGSLDAHCGRAGPEPVERWRLFSRQASALMRIAARLHRDEEPPAEDWRIVYESSAREAPWWRRGVGLERFKLGNVVTEWLRLGNVRPVAVWHTDGEGGVRLEMAVGGLFGAIARELAFLIARVDGFEPCAECGRFFTPKRRPVAGRRSFCPSCRKAGAPHKHANRDLRARRRR